MSKSIMAVGAHADDVELHFGGTLFKYMDKGYDVVYVQASNNMSGCVRTLQADGSHLKSVSYDTETTMEYRKREAAEAARLFAAEPIHLDHPQRHCHIADGKGGVKSLELRYGCVLPPGVPADVPSILTAHEHKPSMEALAKLILEHAPEVIFTHGYAETNPEHHCTCLLVTKAYWYAVEQGYQGSLLVGVRGFSILGRVGTAWETYVDITGYFDRRMAAVQKHASQYPPDFQMGVDYWRDIVETRGRACGVGALEPFNFINEAKPGAGGELTDELLRNRADKTLWNL